MTGNFSTGAAEVDEKLKNLMQLLKQAYDEFIIGINIDEVLLDDLYNSMTNFFDSEESWMTETSSPDLVVHKAEHERCALKFVEIYNHYKHDADTSIAILMILNTLIQEHTRRYGVRLMSASALHCSRPNIMSS